MGVHEHPLHISDGVLADLHRRLESVRWPTSPVRPAWQDGVSLAVVDELIRRWRDGFDWRAREHALNQYSHLWIKVDGVKLHVMFSRPDAAANPTDFGAPLPLLALHGWPDTFEQMTRLADQLRCHEHGMTVVAPSLPGFGFSSAPTEPGWDLARIARVMNTVMVQHLGFDRYLVRGTDYGLEVALHLGATFPEHVAGVHIGGTHLSVPDDSDLPGDLTEEEHRFIESSRAWYKREGAYAIIHATKPETLAYALSDSPVGLLAWIAEKYRTWCATPDNVYATFTADDLLSTATIYWATNTIASSMRLYREDLLGPGVPRSAVPVALSQPALEEYLTPLSWWQRSQPVVRHTLLPGAAHFPEWEAPRALAADIFDFAVTLE